MKRVLAVFICISLLLGLAACATQTAAVPSAWLAQQGPGEPARTPSPGLPRLVTDRHTAYMGPLWENCFIPDAAVTRGQAAQILCALMEEPRAGVCSFSDLSPEDDCWDAVGCLAVWGVVSDSSGRFRPDDPVTRGELLTMLMAFYPPPGQGQRPYVGSFLRRQAETGGPSLPELPSFTDIAGHWAETAVENAVDRGWLTPGGAYYPDTPLSRAEFCRLMNAVLGRSGDLGVMLLTGAFTFFDDVPPEDPDCADVMEACCAHDYAVADGVENWTGFDLAPGFHRADGRLFYVQEDGTLLRDTDWEVWHFDENGCYTTGIERLDEMVQDILLGLRGDTNWERLRAAYLYTTDARYIKQPWDAYGFTDDVDWESSRALRFFLSGGGVCYDYAAAFGILARALGYRAYVVAAEVNEYYAPHGFVVIQGTDDGVNYIYDPELESTRPERHANFGLFRITNHSIYDYWYDPWW